MTTLQTICIFIGGYLLSRLLLRADGHEVFVVWLARRCAGRVSQMVLGVMLGAFLLSTFVPNALTVLALIPVVAAIRRGNSAGPPQLGTLLAIALVYGSNIGGMASLVGSPANLYLLVNLHLFHVPGTQALHFVSWLVFGLPMGCSLLVGCWAMLQLTERQAMRVRLEPTAELARPTPLLRTALGWSILWLVFWIGLLGLVAGTGRGSTVVWQPGLWGTAVPVTGADAVSVMFTVLLLLALFGWPHHIEGKRVLLLHLRDLVREVPLKALAFGAVVLVLLVVVAKSGAVGYLERWAPRLLPARSGAFGAALVLVLVAIYSSELLSNTAVATVLFPIAMAVAKPLGLAPLLPMLGVSLASTCSFMTPIATPANALAFAGIGGVSLKRFMVNGALANLMAGLWIAAWICWGVPVVLAWFA